MKKLLVPLVVLLLGGGGFISPVEASSASPREQLAQLRAMRQAAEARNSGKAQGESQQVSQPVQPFSDQAQVAQASPSPPPVIPAVPVSTEYGHASQQEQGAHTPFQTGGGESSLFGGDDRTNVRLDGEYQGIPDQSHSKASVTLAPQGQPFLVQVTGEQTTGTCPAGPGGSCEYDSRRLDVYGAYRFWTNTTEGNIGPFVRFQDNGANGTWRSPDGLYSGSWKSDKTQTDVGLRFRLRHRLAPGASSNPWVGVGGEYDFANGGYDAFGEFGVRPGNPKNPWNLYAQGGVNTDGGYAYPEITTPNLIGDANSKLQVQLQAKGVFYALGRDNSSSRVELGLPLTLNVSHNTAIQVVPAYVFGLDSNTKSGFGGAVRVRIGF